MVLIYCCVVLTILLFIAAHNFIQQIKRRKHAILVVNWLKQMRELLELFPKHRGMANAFLKGDSTFRSAMEKLQQTTDKKIQSLRQLTAERDDWSEHQGLHRIEQAWQHIKQNVFTMPADRCFAEHSDLIELVIERLEDDALELSEYFNRNASGKQKQLISIIGMLTRELPQVVESMGQARGIGTGVAAQQSSSVANRVNLKYLHDRALSILNNKLTPLHSAINKQQGLKEFAKERYINNAIDTSRQFLTMLEKELINTTHPTVAPDNYYQQGTKAIEAELKLFDHLFPLCTQSLELT